MTKDEALKIALEALKRATNYDPVIARAITAIKEALAQEQEPVICAECERLKDALKRANGLAEHFEREWYLRGDEIERFKAQPEQKPVAGWTGNTNADAALVMLDRLDVSPDDDDRVDEISNIVRRLATPPQRKPLTDEEITKEVEAELTHYWNGEYIDTTGARDQLTAFARAIEAAHGIKEQL